jgi:beta-lactamase superfamily II metal-dependent hydrolase
MTEPVYTLTMLKAGKGDAIWISVGKDPDVKHILIDTGPDCGGHVLKAQVEAMERKYGKPVVISLLVISHIDDDHISGAEYFLRNLKNLNLKIEALWFNGYRQVFAKKKEARDALGENTAESVSAWAETLGIPINPGLPEDCALTTVSWTQSQVDRLGLPEGLAISLLGPTPERIQRLKLKWETKMKGKPGQVFDKALTDVLGASDPGNDVSKANGSSITLLLEYAGKTVLLSADAFASDLADALAARSSKDITFFKLSHHGSFNNVSASLIAANPAPHYLVSGNVPHNETVTFVHGHRPDALFHFNYDAPREKIIQAVPAIRLGPAPGDTGLVLDLIAT